MSTAKNAKVVTAAAPAAPEATGAVQKPRGKRAAKASVCTETVPTQPAAAPPAEKKPPRRSTKSKPAEPPASGEEPVAVDTAYPSKPTRRVSQPVSPRAAAAPFASARKGATNLSPADVKKHTIQLSRSVGRYAQITNGVLKAQNGEYTTGGKVYTKADLKEMTKDMAKAIERLPGIFRATNSRRKELQISDEERSLRREALLARAREGCDILAHTVNIPKLADVLYEKAKFAIDSKKKLSRPESSRQITSQFYVTNQFVDFVKSGNFGNGLALLFPNVSDKTHAIPCANDCRPGGGTKYRDEAIAAVERECADILDGKSLVEYLETDLASLYKLADPRTLLLLLLNNNVATSPLLMTIMARYNSVNGLTDPVSKRIHVDKNMTKHFGPGTNSRWLLNKTDFTPTQADVDAAEDPAERERLKSIVDRANLSIYEQLKNYTPKRRHANDENSLPPFDGETYERSIAIVIASMCHIGNIPDSQLMARLKDPRVAALTVGINIYI